MTAKTTYKRRTREEILSWLKRARERKHAWEEQTELELKKSGIQQALEDVDKGNIHEAKSVEDLMKQLEV